MCGTIRFGHGNASLKVGTLPWFSDHVGSIPDSKIAIGQGKEKLHSQEDWRLTCRPLRQPSAVQLRAASRRFLQASGADAPPARIGDSVCGGAALASTVPQPRMGTDVVRW